MQGTGLEGEADLDRRVSDGERDRRVRTVRIRDLFAEKEEIRVSTIHLQNARLARGPYETDNERSVIALETSGKGTILGGSFESGRCRRGPAVRASGVSTEVRRGAFRRFLRLDDAIRRQIESDDRRARAHKGRRIATRPEESGIEELGTG